MEGMGEWSGSCRILVRKSERKRPLVRPRHRRENNTKIYLLKLVWRRVLGLDSSG